MTRRVFLRRSRIAASAEEVYRWHARPGAFERLNPPWDPAVVESRTGGIEDEGARVVLRVGPARQRFVAEHHGAAAGREFHDRQVSGPFALWEHAHRMTPEGPRACTLEDRIEYALPAGAAGDLVGGSLVHGVLERMFAYRHRITADDLVSEAETCDQLVGDVDPVELSYDGDGPIVVIGGANDPATPIRWAHELTARLGPNARMVTYTGEGHGQLLVSSCVTDIESALLTDLVSPDPDTVCGTDPVVERPDWWDALPAPGEVSDVVALPALAAALGATPTQLFSEMRTTSLNVDEAISAYTDALGDDGFQQFDAPPALPLEDVAQAAFVDAGGRALLVVAIGPTAFEDKSLQSAKVEVPPNTTVVWLIAIPI